MRIKPGRLVDPKPDVVSAQPEPALAEVGRWHRRRALVWVARVAGIVLPPASAVLISLGLASILPPPLGTLESALWWACFVAAALGVYLFCGRLARVLLVLGSLFDLDLAFPELPPSRLEIARRVARPRYLEVELAQARRLLEGDRHARPEDSRLSPRSAPDFLLLSLAVNAHDAVSPGHSERVAAIADRVAARLGVAAAERRRLQWAALLHDVGKLAVPAAILHSTEPLSRDEWAEIERHPTAGAVIAAPLAAWLGPWAAAIAEHHERWDGNGYPGRLAGPGISLAGRIVAVADAYETMTAARVYKRPMGRAGARAQLAFGAGSQFDPEVVTAFLGLEEARPAGARRLAGLARRASRTVASTPLVATLNAAGAAATGAAITALVAAFTLAGAVPPRLVAPPPDQVRSRAVAGVSGGPAATDQSPQQAGTTPAPGPVGGRARPTGPAPQSTPAPAPAVTLETSRAATEGVPLTLTGTFIDPWSARWSATVDYGDGGGARPLTLRGKGFSLTHRYMQEGVFRAVVRVVNEQGLAGVARVTVYVTEFEPVLAPIANATYSRGSGAPFVASGSFSDPSADKWSARVTWGDGSAPVESAINGRAFQLSHGYAANGVYTVIVTLFDGVGHTASTSFQVTVQD